MKANAPRRQIFTDAVDLLTGGDTQTIVSENGIQMLDIDAIHPFHAHPFRLYEGERLDDMVSSIQEHGVLTPVIVRKMETGYEMLAGHNRQNAARLAGLKKIPAIVKEGLSNQDAYVYVIETNLMQRSFTDLLPSEKAAVLAERYDKVCDQGRRNDILRELELLNGNSPDSTSGLLDQKLGSRETVGKEYGLSSRAVARLLRVNYLISPLKSMLDSDLLPLYAAVELSFIQEPAQGWVYDAVDALGLRLTIQNATRFRQEAEDLTEQRVMEIAKELVGGNKTAIQFKSVKLSTGIYQKYFSETKAEQIPEIIEQALNAYFAQNRLETD
jgi:ParB family chromosome partitioning protein